MDILNQGPRMDCTHFIKVSPITTEDDEGQICWSISEYHRWLKENKIIRYRGGEWPRETQNYYGQDIVFRFERMDDAMAFKLAWV